MTFLYERVRLARLQRNLSQKSLAEAVGYVPGYISDIERGKVVPPRRLIQSLGQVLNKKPGYFTDPTIPEDSGELAEDETAKVKPEAPTELNTWLDACRLLVQQGVYEQALQRLKDIDQTSLNEEQLQAARFIQAQALNRTNQTRQAREILRELVAGLVANATPSIAQVYYELGAGYVIEQQFETAIEQYQLALKALEPKVQEDKLGFRLYAELGRVHRQSGELSQAAFYYEKARQHPLAHHDDRAMAGMLLSEGLKLMQEGEFGEARAKLAESESLFEKLNLIEQYSTVASYLNVVHAQLNEFDKIDNQRLSLLDRSSATSEVIIMANQVAVLRLRGDAASLIQAQEHKERTLLFLNSQQNEIPSVTAAQVYHEAALLAVALNKEEEALATFEKTLDLLHTHRASWSELEKLYDDYEQALLNWERDSDLARVSRQRIQDKKQFK
jgi:transcriptional regulator with XRE-family HTH domain